MNNTCPSCGATYNITAAMIGREVVCKKCSSELVITEAGIELKDAPPPPPARRAGSSGSNVAPSRRPAAPARVQEEPEEEEDYDEDEAPAPRSGNRYGKGGARPARKRSSSGGLNSSNSPMTPVVIMVMFWVITAAALIRGLLAAIDILELRGGLQVVLYGFAVMAFGLFLLRLFCELVVVGLRIYTTLLDIRSELKSQR